ncbi:MAG: transpeptidase family protein [Tannerella sp.]|jgi:cell division protein FtsI (penicillin-binding protein 3)|nr:transpeptidase family protein [Tannerella sp.]
MDKNKDVKEKTSVSNQILGRYAIVVGLLCLVVFSIVFFTIKIAFTEKEKWEKLEQGLQQPNKLVNASRGNIYSSDGELMATNVPYYLLYMDFQADGFNTDTFLHSKRNGIDSLAFYLSKKLKDRTAAAYKTYLLRGLKSKSREFKVSDKQVSYFDLKEISKYPYYRTGRNRSGFYTKEIVIRQKIFGSLASRTIGDIKLTFEKGYSIGRLGLELQYDSLLRGKTGLRTVVNVGGRWTNVIVEEPVSGYDIYTTIDLQMQDFTEKALSDKLKAIDAESGTAVIMEVQTGEIKAISNLTRIRPGVYAEVKNHAVADEIEPGSTFKIASVMVALEDKVCSPDEIIDAGNGVYTYRRNNIVDHNANKGGYHKISVAEAIWYSSNIGIAKVIIRGYEQNPQRFVDGLSRIGIDADLKVEIPGAGWAKIRKPKDRQWSKITLPWMSFGYEVQIPPIYTLAFFNAIANEGKMIRPIFVKEIRQNGKTVERFATEVIRTSVCSEETLNIIQDMLVNVIEKGTGSAVHSDAVSIAGKTGTSQIAAGGGYQSHNAHNVSFCGYFPAHKPQYTGIVVIRRPRIGYPSGGMMSGDVFKTIAEKIYSHQVKYDIRSVENDLTKGPAPAIKSGNTKALKYVLDELSIKSKIGDISTAYVSGKQTNDKQNIEVRELVIKEGLVPHVIGMGAKDAVYALENCGLRVNLSGRGAVVSQSIAPGQRVVKGQTIGIVLRN